MAIDRSGAEAVENRHAVEKPSSPPPDRPGAEGFPSRAESRAAAAADQRQHSDRAAERPAPSAEEHDATPEENTESAADQDDGERPAREDGASDSPDEADHEPPGSLTTDLPGSQDVRDEPATTDRQQARDGVAPPHDEVGTAGSERSSLEQQYSLEEPRLDDPPAREDLEPASVPAETAAAHTATGHGQEADTAEPPLGVAAETAEDHYVQDQRSRTDQPETETPPAADNPDQGNSEPAVDATELAEPTGPAEDQGVEARSDDTVDNGDTAEPSGALDQPADVDKDTLDTDTKLVNGLDGPDQAPSADGGAEPASATEEERTPTFEFTTEDGQLVRAYLDRDDESNGLELPGSPPDPPTGHELLEMDNDDLSRPEKARRKFLKAFEDANDVAGKTANASHDIVSPRPTGHAETRAPDRVVAVDAQHAGVDPGSAAGAALALGVVGAEAIRWAHRRTRR